LRREEKEMNVDVFYIREGRRRRRKRKEACCCEMRDSRLFISAFYQWFYQWIIKY
jgi:hypothetical protein